MDNINSNRMAFNSTNPNLERIMKEYAKGGNSVAEILDNYELSFDFESLAIAQQCFIPKDYLREQPDFEGLLKRKVKIKNETTPTPFIPGKVFFTNSIDSSLTKRQQAICLVALKIAQNGIAMDNLHKLQKQDVELARGLQKTVQEENVKFLEYVKSDWNDKRVNYLKMPLRNFAYKAWQKKLKSPLNYPQFYKPMQIIPFLHQGVESNVSVNHVANLYEIGIVPKFVKPSLEIKYLFKYSTLPDDNPPPCSKLPVSQDLNIDRLIKKAPVDLVISSSGLKQLMDDTNTNTEWIIPVIVKRHHLQAEKIEKNVVYVDKPITKRTPTPIDFNYYCQKMLVKTNFCCYPGIIYGATDIQTCSDPIDDDDDAEPEVDLKKMRDISTTSNTCIDYMEELENYRTLVGTSKQVLQKFNLPGDKNEIHHNVSYRVWNLKSVAEKNELLKTKSSNKDLHIIIRCKLDACERLPDGTIRPLVIVPKLEYQVEHGATIPTKKEIIDQWTALFFRPFSNLYRMRMQANNSEIVDVQSVSLQRINMEASSCYDYKPHLRLDALYEIFCKLTDLAPGKYLLRYCNKKGPFIEVCLECDCTISTERFNFYSFYDDEFCMYTHPTGVPWTPIDPSYILPVHTTFKRMPGMFRPLITTTCKARLRRNKKRLTVRNKKKAQLEHHKFVPKGKINGRESSKPP